MNMKALYIIIVALLIIVAVYLWYYQNQNTDLANIDTFEDCVAAGYPVMESYPRQCRTPNGRTYIENIGNVDKSDLIQVESPRPNAEVVSPMVIKGKARGTWFFEASFPVKLVDANGKVLAQMPAQAIGEWMTPEFVPFNFSLAFATPTAEMGTLILMKDNPSGLPEHDDELRIPVVFKTFEADGKILGDTMEVKVYLSKNNSAECNEVFPVTRIVPKTTAVAKTALEELLKGPTGAEKNAGFISVIPAGSKLNSITIADGVAKADFNATAESGGGSCSMAARTAQIRETLLQFPTVKSVELSINGRTGDIFQP